MFEIEGNFTSAKVYAGFIDDYAKAQIQMICDNPASEGSSIAIMPDVHPGKVGPVGLTMTVGERVLPALIGPDIGCGIDSVAVTANRFEPQKLDRVIRDNVPSGRNLRKAAHHKAVNFDFDRLCCKTAINKDKAALSLGTLGSGNHFIELGKNSSGTLHLTVHTGSRHLGMEVYEYYMKKGADELKNEESVPYEMTYLTGDLMKDYLSDMEIVIEYAALNRQIILSEIMQGMKFKPKEHLDSIHNYIDSSGTKPMLRKGAISAGKGESVIIPINMRDGIIIGRGKGNEEWNYSAPHGSGRLYRRDEVARSFTVKDYKESMKGIYSPSIDKTTLDEAPFAYRGIDEILPIISETVDVQDIIKPVYSFKAGGYAK